VRVAHDLGDRVVVAAPYHWHEYAKASWLGAQADPATGRPGTNWPVLAAQVGRTANGVETSVHRTPGLVSQRGQPE